MRDTASLRVHATPLVVLVMYISDISRVDSCVKKALLEGKKAHNDTSIRTAVSVIN